MIDPKREMSKRLDFNPVFCGLVLRDHSNFIGNFRENFPKLSLLRQIAQRGLAKSQIDHDGSVQMVKRFIYLMGSG